MSAPIQHVLAICFALAIPVGIGIVSDSDPGGGYTPAPAETEPEVSDWSDIETCMYDCAPVRNRGILT